MPVSRLNIRFVLITFLVVLGLASIILAKNQLAGSNIEQILSKTHGLPEQKLSDLLPSKAHINIKIDKSEYKLYVYHSDTLVKSYPVVFGGNPIDDKRMQGDQCTPEGNFKINSKYPHKSWSKFIWLNYPTPDSWKKHKDAKSKGYIPAEAKIGGEIGIHGVPNGMDFLIDIKQNWTLGCISLKNKDVNEMYPFIDKSTSIKIQK